MIKIASFGCGVDSVAGLLLAQEQGIEYDEIIFADTGNEIMIGSVLGSDSGDDTTIGSFNAEVGDAFSSIEFTGATEGELGSRFTLTCYDTDRWLIDGTVLHDGSIATPFATS